MTSQKGKHRWRNRWLKGEFENKEKEKKDKTLEDFEEKEDGNNKSKQSKC